MPDMYEGVRTQVKSSVGLTDKIPVSVWLHQGSSLIPYLFAIIMDVSACRIKDLYPWCMLYALYCVASKERRWKINSKSGEVL